MKIRADTPISGSILTFLEDTPSPESVDAGTTSLPKNLSTRPSSYAPKKGRN
ncbi:hypothetical protein SLEP1_g32357 [Rubroshorea leprosula]|uniref:Uncharacterized protein n=1 Tax=Rubroshorea leprosula TaxID=152421 RepID=A0AAV5KD86_9ROSI|nr:hypothetical protein SLEP1_g32357 [Rubroshorea leprosula]